MLNKIIELIKSPLKLFIFLNNRKILVLPDRMYLKIRYYATFHKKLNLEEPKHLMKNYNGLNYMIETQGILKW